MEKKSKKKTVAHTVKPVPAPVVLTKTDAEKFWDELKDVRLEMFALPNQFVNTYYRPIMIEPSKLYLVAKTTASSALSALEDAIKFKYVVEQADRFVIVSLAPVKK